MPHDREGLSFRRHLIVAAILFGFEVLFGVGLIGGMGMFIAPVILLSPVQNRPRFLKRLQVAAIYVCLVIATFALLQFNWKVAERRAAPVIAACKQFRAHNGRYPEGLDELVPTYLSSVPDARYTLIERKFGYDENRPSLYFAVMFFGVVYYDFQTNRWIT